MRMKFDLDAFILGMCVPLIPFLMYLRGWFE